MRDNKAIARLAEGFLKLLFPDLVLSEEEFITYCVNPAVRMRQQIRDELSKIDQEYKWVTIKSESPDEFQLSHPDEKPEAEEEAKKVDPLAPNRAPDERTIDIAEGQKGISFEKLFLPYVKGSKLIKIFDPYIRLQYQIYNLVSFCEILDPQDETLKVDLLSGCDAYQRNELEHKFDELKTALGRDKIDFTYSFDDTLHDRKIETDTGWRIILGRGLDIFQKPDDKFTLGVLDQTKRKCKATTITYVRL
jgi:ATP-dependent Lon protease